MGSLILGPHPQAVRFATVGFTIVAQRLGIESENHTSVKLCNVHPTKNNAGYTAYSDSLHYYPSTLEVSPDFVCFVVAARED